MAGTWKICALTFYFFWWIDFFQNLAKKLDTHNQQNILDFVDAVEKVIIEQLQLDPRADAGSG